MARQVFKVGQHVMVTSYHSRRFGDSYREAVVTNPDVYAQPRRGWYGYGSGQKTHYVEVQYLRDGKPEGAADWRIRNASNKIIDMATYEPIRIRQEAQKKADAERPARERAERLQEFGFYAAELVDIANGANGRLRQIKHVADYLMANFEKVTYSAPAKDRWLTERTRRWNVEHADQIAAQEQRILEIKKAQAWAEKLVKAAQLHPGRIEIRTGVNLRKRYVELTEYTYQTPYVTIRLKDKVNSRLATEDEVRQIAEAVWGLNYQIKAFHCSYCDDSFDTAEEKLDHERTCKDCWKTTTK